MAGTDGGEQETVRLEDYLRILRDRAWIVVVSVVIVTLVALYVSLTATSLYSSAARVVYQKNSLDMVASGYGINAYDYDKDRTIATLVAAIENNESIAEAVKVRLGSNEQAEYFMGMVSVSTSEGSDLVDIGAVSADPNEAAAIANAYATEFIEYRRNVDRSAVAEARAAIEQQLETLSLDSAESGYRLVLQEKLENLRILEAMQDGGFTLMKWATVPTVPFTPQTKRNIILAVVVGLVLGVGLAFLVEYLDKRIKDEKTLERVSGLPVLASVPITGEGWKSGKGSRRSAKVIGFEGDGSALLESFRTLRSSLQYFDVDETLRTIVVTSGLPQEGKTVTAVNLAISLALSGKRVVVLEADLRRPMMHEYLNLENKTGLSSVLAGTSSLTSALQLVLMDPFIPASTRKEGSETDPVTLRKNLYCVTSGPLPPNPAELLGSARMVHTISELNHMADYLLIDTPPVLPVSDALTLARHADGVILTARLHATTREEMEQVREILDRAGVRVIGVVAEGVKAKRGYYKRGYSYRGYGYQ